MAPTFCSGALMSSAWPMHSEYSYYSAIHKLDGKFNSYLAFLLPNHINLKYRVDHCQTIAPVKDSHTKANTAVRTIKLLQSKNVLRKTLSEEIYSFWRDFP